MSSYLIIRVFLFDEFLFDNMIMSSDKDNNVAGPSVLAYHEVLAMLGLD